MCQEPVMCRHKWDVRICNVQKTKTRGIDNLEPAKIETKTNLQCAGQNDKCEMQKDGIVQLNNFEASIIVNDENVTIM